MDTILLQAPTDTQSKESLTLLWSSVPALGLPEPQTTKTKRAIRYGPMGDLSDSGLRDLGTAPRLVTYWLCLLLWVRITCLEGIFVDSVKANNRNERSDP